MAFKDTKWIDLKPITLLFGLNSSGKSAIIRAIRLLKQSLLPQNVNTPLTFISEYGINLSSYSNIVHQHDENLSITVEFKINFNDGEISKLLIACPETVDLKIPIIYSFQFGWDMVNREVYIREFSVFQIKESNQRENIFSGTKLLEQVFPVERRKWLFDMHHWWFWSDKLKNHFTDDNAFPWVDVGIAFNKAFLPELITYSNYSQHKEIQFVKMILGKLNEGIQEFFNSVQYLGPIRPEPKRTYALDEMSVLQLKVNGFEPWVKFLRDGMGKSEYTYLNKWLKRLGFKQNIFVDKKENIFPDSIYSQIIAEKANIKINLIDLGYGVSQVLPIIVYCLLAENNSFIIIEEPELHLHPDAQANLADLFIQITNSKNHPSEDESRIIPKNIHFIIETHSENILLRMRKRIAQNSGKVLDADTIEGNLYLESSNLSINYIENPEQFTAQVKNIHVDIWGEYDFNQVNFKQFFNQDVNDIISLKNARFGQE